MKTVVLGIDISKEKFDVALLCGSKWACKTYKNNSSGHNALMTWLKNRDAQNAHICLEATGVYGDGLALALYQGKYNVSVVNPACIKGFSQSELCRTKTDKADAKLIARYTQAMKPLLFKPEEKRILLLRQWTRRLDNLNGIIGQEKNRLDVSCPEVTETILDHITILEAQIVIVKEKIKEIIDDNDDLKTKSDLLETIPGVSEATIPRILAYIGNPERFETAKEMAAFVGLNPKQRQSGTSVHGRTRLSKMGNAHMRKALYMPALVAIRHNPTIQAFSKRLEEKGKAKKSIIGAAMRKLVHIIYGILKTQTPFIPLHKPKNTKKVELCA